uniref:Uncharacterized protein n=1 Tax=Emiliania huxleyi (strain CCMP1516) TaxID=280463 RepID=A0A0D3KQL2_EMIH1
MEERGYWTCPGPDTDIACPAFEVGISCADFDQVCANWCGRCLDHDITHHTLCQLGHDPALGRGPTLGAGSEYPQNTVVRHCSCEGPEQLPASVTCPYQIACPEGCRFAPGRELVDSSEVYVAHDKHHDRSLLFASTSGCPVGCAAE